LAGGWGWGRQRETERDSERQREAERSRERQRDPAEAPTLLLPSLGLWFCWLREHMNLYPQEIFEGKKA
jgi:hypothetical protein